MYAIVRESIMYIHSCTLAVVNIFNFDLSLNHHACPLHLSVLGVWAVSQSLSKSRTANFAT